MDHTESHPNPIDAFLAAVVTGDVSSCSAWAEDAELDATVPNWRFTVRGADAIRAEYGRWFAQAGKMDELRRLPTADGEVVEYVVSWEELGIPHAAHHVHILRVRDGHIAADTVMCGGRWPAALLAQMEEAAHA